MIMSSWKRAGARAIKQEGEGKDGVEGEGLEASSMEFHQLENTRKQQWKSFIFDLEEECDDDPLEPVEVQNNDATQFRQPEAGAGGSTAKKEGPDDAAAAPTNQVGKSTWNNHPGAAMNSLYMQQLRGIYNVGVVNQVEDDAIAVVALPSTLPLCDWIAHYSATSNQTPLAYMKRIDKSYLEKATVVALSLAKNLDERYGGSCSNVIIHEKDLLMENITVTNKSDGEVDVVYVSLASATKAPAPQQQNQRPAIFALGKIYYELFTQGCSCCLPLSTLTSGQKPTVDSFSDPSSFDVALKITGDTSNEDEGSSSSEDDTRQRRKQPRRVTEKDECSHYTQLQLAGLPPSLCRLVSDMLENGDGSGVLFLHDQSVAKLSDVISDLSQMVECPKSFLHDSLIIRLEPIIPDKLYGRNHELQKCLDVADEVISQRESIKSSVEISHPQSAIMISGFSG